MNLLSRSIRSKSPNSFLGTLSRRIRTRSVVLPTGIFLPPWLAELNKEFPLPCLDMGGIEPAIVQTESCQFEGFRRDVGDPGIDPHLEPPHGSPLLLVGPEIEGDVEVHVIRGSLRSFVHGWRYY